MYLLFKQKLLPGQLKRVYNLLNETAAMWTWPRPLIAIFGLLPHSKGRGGGAMTPPVSEWAAGSCAVSRP